MRSANNEQQEECTLYTQIMPADWFKNYHILWKKKNQYI